jgi:hypothetical protein
MKRKMKRGRKCGRKGERKKGRKKGRKKERKYTCIAIIRFTTKSKSQPDDGYKLAETCS